MFFFATSKMMVGRMVFFIFDYKCVWWVWQNGIRVICKSVYWTKHWFISHSENSKKKTKSKTLALRQKKFGYCTIRRQIWYNPAPGFDPGKSIVSDVMFVETIKSFYIDVLINRFWWWLSRQWWERVSICQFEQNYKPTPREHTNGGESDWAFEVHNSVCHKQFQNTQ